jgi:hypothetical protein
MIKYADDTVIVGLLDDSDAKENDLKYRKEIELFVDWCEKNFLILNVEKTKEIIVDFRQKKDPIHPIVINADEVKIVETYKYLGTVIDSKLKGSENISKIAKKANQRLYFTRKLKKVGVNRNILSMFYQSTVESIISFCILCWYGNSGSDDRK